MVKWDPVQKQEIFFFEGHRSFFCIKMPFRIGHPPPTHQLQSTCVWEGSRVPNLQTEFNYLDSFKSDGIFSDFIVPLVPSLSPSSPSSPHHPHCPHSPQKVPMWSPWLWSPWSPPHVVHVILIIPTSSPLSPHCPHSPQKVPMWSPCLWSPSSPHHPHRPHIIPTSSRRSPHIPNPPDTHCTHPHPPGGGGPESVKMQ